MPVSINVEQIESNMRQLKLGALAKNWANIQFTNKEQYIVELLELELRAREDDRIGRLALPVPIL